MPKLDLKTIIARQGSIYPGRLGDIIAGRSKQALGDAGGLDQFGVNLTCLKPGSGSAHRHWHASEDEFIYILEGEAVLVEDEGEVLMRKGDAACFKAGIENGHHLVNRSQEDVLFLEVGTRLSEEIVTYTDPDVDMKVGKQKGQWYVTRKDGSSF